MNPVQTLANVRQADSLCAVRSTGQNVAQDVCKGVQIFVGDTQPSDFLNAEAQAVTAIDALVVDPDTKLVELLGCMRAEGAFEQQ
ncbi:hypothetical protein D3C75_1283490 [compost metagenome]